MPAKTRALPGDIHGRLTVLGEAEPTIICGNKIRTVYVRCSCGNETTARVPDLVKGHTKSCGCLAREHLEAKQARMRKVTPEISATFRALLDEGITRGQIADATGISYPTVCRVTRT